MYCKHCGNQIDNDSNFCSFCGGKIIPLLNSYERTLNIASSYSLITKPAFIRTRILNITNPDIGKNGKKGDYWLVHVACMTLKAAQIIKDELDKKLSHYPATILNNTMSVAVSKPEQMKGLVNGGQCEVEIEYITFTNKETGNTETKLAITKIFAVEVDSVESSQTIQRNNQIKLSENYHFRKLIHSKAKYKTGKVETWLKESVNSSNIAYIKELEKGGWIKYDPKDKNCKCSACEDNFSFDKVAWLQEKWWEEGYQEGLSSKPFDFYCHQCMVSLRMANWTGK